MISSISFNPDYSGLYAAGSFSGDISVYAENSGAQSFFDIVRLGYGVDTLKWSPCGRYLWISGRNNPEITCWDVRNTKRQVGTVTRSISSNQRNKFAIDPWGQYLIAGDDQGKILSFDTQTFKCIREIDTGCCNTVNACHFHPYSALIIASQGERTFNMPSLSESSTDSDKDDDTDSEQEKTGTTIETEKVVCDQATETTSTGENHIIIADDSIASLLGKRKALLMAKEKSQSGSIKSRTTVEREYSKVSPESRVVVFSLEKMPSSTTEQISTSTM